MRRVPKWWKYGRILMLLIASFELLYHRYGFSENAISLKTAGKEGAGIEQDELIDRLTNSPPQTWFQDQFKKSRQLQNLSSNITNEWKKCKNQYLTYYFPKINTIFTGIPKTGSTNWKAALLLAEGTLKKMLEPHQMKRIQGGMSNMHRLQNIGRNYSNEALKSAFSFAVIRNPWTRMVSGYIDKFSEGMSRGSYRGVGKGMVRTLRGITNETLLNNLYPTFGEYMKWLTKKKGLDRHFTPQSNILCYSGHKYDFILPLEYSSVLSADVWGKIKINATLNRSYDHVSDPRLQSSTIRAKEWILKVDSSILERVYEIFKADFALANYSNVTHPDFPLPSYR